MLAVAPRSACLVASRDALLCAVEAMLCQQKHSLDPSPLAPHVLGWSPLCLYMHNLHLEPFLFGCNGRQAPAADSTAQDKYQNHRFQIRS
jgi:hypothetical protein